MTEDRNASIEQLIRVGGTNKTAGVIRLREREFFIDNLLVRIRFIIAMIRWTGLAPWDFEFPFPGSVTSTCLAILLTL